MYNAKYHSGIWIGLNVLEKAGLCGRGHGKPHWESNPDFEMALVMYLYLLLLSPGR